MAKWTHGHQHQCDLSGWLLSHGAPGLFLRESMPGVMNALFEPLRAAGVPKRKERAVLSLDAQADLSHANCPDACPNGGWWLGVTEPLIRNT